MSQEKIILTNQFGEQSNNTFTNSSGQTLADELPPKTAVAALSAIDPASTLTQTVTQLNALLAALKVQP